MPIPVDQVQIGETLANKIVAWCSKVDFIVTGYYVPKALANDVGSITVRTLTLLQDAVDTLPDMEQAKKVQNAFQGIITKEQQPILDKINKALIAQPTLLQKVFDAQKKLHQKVLDAQTNVRDSIPQQNRNEPTSGASSKSSTPLTNSYKERGLEFKSSDSDHASKKDTLTSEETNMIARVRNIYII